MTLSLLISSIIVFVCVLINKFSSKIGIPTLVLFIFLGMMLGSEGIGKISFDNYKISENICTTALIFIMFYGGFGTNWKSGRKIAKEALALSTLGVLASAFISGIIFHYLLSFTFWESFLLGSVIASTDAASVFSILRSKNLGIKENVAPVLEIESGSNDPFAYMCMLICVMVLKGNTSSFEIAKVFFLQLMVGISSSLIIAKLSLEFLKKFTFDTEGFDQIFFVSLALFSYAFPTFLGGNGFLSCYIVGIILGNKKIKNKISLIHFFDGITNLMQVVLFFMLGLLSTPSMIWAVKEQFFFVFLTLSLIGRPIAVFLLYSFFKKVSVKKKFLISFCGLRGAASIVFAIIVLGSGIKLSFDIFHIIFGTVLLSITLQGSLIPYVTKKLDMIDENENILKTFSDYTEDIPIDYISVNVSKNHPWIGKTIKQLNLPPDLIIVSIEGKDGTVLPKGDVAFQEGDCIALAAIRFEKGINFSLSEIVISKDSDYIGKKIHQLSIYEQLIILVVRKDNPIIPNGNTVLFENDILILSQKL